MGGVSSAALARQARASVTAAGSGSFSPSARRAIADDESSLLINAATAWETTTRYRLGKLADGVAVALDSDSAIADQGF